MSLNRYQGICFVCGKIVPPGKGDFQSRKSISVRQRSLVTTNGKWLVRCFSCKRMGNEPNKFNYSIKQST